MKWGTGLVFVALAIASVALVLPATPGAAPHASGPALPAPLAVVHAPVRHSAAAAVHGPATSGPSLTFPRTIVVESFTGMWCPYCPSEGQALREIQANASPGTLTIPELHVCNTGSKIPGPSCGDNYLAADGIYSSRESTYGITGFPTAVINAGPYSRGSYGISGSCTASYSGQAACIPLLVGSYGAAIHNASLYPGNVSITQQAFTTFGGPGSVSVYGNITSGVSGTYQAITYLVQFININTTQYCEVPSDYPHYIGDIVWRALFDQNVVLAAGGTTSFQGTGLLNTTWDIHNLSVVTLVQQNATYLPIENANQSVVSTASVHLALGTPTINSTESTPVTVTVTNATTGTPLAGAAVRLSALGGGSFSAATGTTNANGKFTTNYTGPAVSGIVMDRITADVSGAGLIPASSATLVTVQPLVAPSAPQTVSVVPAGTGGQVQLNWQPPASGGAGLTYHVYRSSTVSGPFVQIGTNGTTSFGDASATAGAVYWYEVSAHGPGGFSLNSTPVEADPVAAVTSGSAASVGWSLTIDSVELNSTTNAAIDLHLAPGAYPYTVSSGSYSYLPTDPSDSLYVTAGGLTTLNVQFAPNYATLDATVTPADATVLFNHTSVALVNGAFTEIVFAGEFTIQVSASGYVTNTTSVTLTPGNTTKVTISLQPLASGSSPQTGGLTGAEIIGLAGIAAVVVLATVGFVVWSRRGRAPPGA